jgi:CDP-glycerol glycerophosphotransferase
VSNPLKQVAKVGYRLLSVSAASRVSDFYLSAKFDYLSIFAKQYATNTPIPKVTLVVPVYNVERYLELCLKSIRAQRYPNLDVILVNDGSTDNSLAIARKYQEKLPLHIVDQENAGLGAARNSGVASIQSTDFLMFLDSDDALAPGALNTLVGQAISTGSDFVIGDTTRMKGLTRLKRRDTRELFSQGNQVRKTFAELPKAIQDLTAWNRLFRFDFYKASQIEFPAGVFFEDMAPMIKALIQSKQFDLISQTVIYWRVRTEGAKSITQETSQSQKITDRLVSLVLQRDLILSAVASGRATSENLAEFYSRVKKHDFKLYEKTASKEQLDLFAEFLEPGI